MVLLVIFGSMSKTLKTILALSVFPQIIIVKLLGKHPDLIEKYYSNGIYPVISKISRYVFGWIPFSVGDILYTFAGFLILRFLILKGRWFFTQTRIFFREVFITISLAYAIFHLGWGLNYYREPLHKTLHLANEYTSEELFDFTKKLIQKSNEAHAAITPDSTEMVIIPYTKREMYRMSGDGYKILSKKYPNLAYEPVSIKSSLYSIPLSYMGYGGYLNPFTNEAQVNDVQINFKYPTVCCHEEAHQIGYSAENEANFVGYLAAINNPDKYFKYSGYIFVLRYCMGEIKRRDPVRFEEYNKLLYPGIIKNYIEVTQFWQKHQSAAEPVFKNTYNTFLKANNQKEGLRTYSYVVALLINYYKENAL
ncbi:DUF3810 domain-containing protein [Zhouia sp. PK063]|uniref:DUF3810 domain-containing protein n=1 Tax=Zhouia sp. PK063 TaxID=3373602 RepID=UPI0037B16D29